METRSGKRKIIASRVAYLRAQKGWSQAELAKKLSEFSTKKTNISTALISMWESNARNIPIVHLEPLSDLFGVTGAYLCGLTDDPDETYEQIVQKEKTQKKETVYEIEYWQLHAYDKQPIYIVFDNYEHENGWAIYNRNRNIFIFYEDVLKETSLAKLQVHYYTKDITRGVDPLNKQRSLDMVSMLKRDQVFISMNTPDRTVRGLYDGWYHHNENHTALINSFGLVLPYEGLKVSYRAFAYADTDDEKIFTEDDKQEKTEK